MHRSSLEQLCFGALAANMEHTRALGPGQNVRVRVTRNVAPGFTSSTAVLHFFTPHKPWRPLSADRLVHILKGGWPMFPFYRMVWLDYASRIEGFEEFCDERPYSSVEIMSVANAVLLTNRRALGEVKLG